MNEDAISERLQAVIATACDFYDDCDEDTVFCPHWKANAEQAVIRLVIDELEATVCELLDRIGSPESPLACLDYRQHWDQEGYKYPCTRCRSLAAWKGEVAHATN